VRYPVIVVLAGAGLIGVVVVLYDAGWLPIAGPFAAVVIAAVIVYVVMWWRARRLRRLSTTAAEQLRALMAALTEERALAAPARPTRASDASLDQALTQAEGALQQLAWGHEQGAVPLLVNLGDVARRDWADEAPLSRQVADLDDTATELERVVRRMLETAARRRSS
jgi:hypothetical protein